MCEGRTLYDVNVYVDIAFHGSMFHKLVKA